MSVSRNILKEVILDAKKEIRRYDITAIDKYANMLSIAVSNKVVPCPL